MHDTDTVQFSCVQSRNTDRPSSIHYRQSVIEFDAEWDKAWQTGVKPIERKPAFNWRIYGN